MTETGWIIVGIIAVIAIILIMTVLRRKSTGALPGVSTPAELLPEQVTPEAPVLAESVIGHPQTIEAESTPPVSAKVEPTFDIPAVETVEPDVVPDVEPVALAPVPAVKPSPVAPAAPVASASGEGDNLLKLKGVGPKIATLLKAEGITRFADIAAWGEADIAAIDAKLGSFAGRPQRDNWIDQASFLAAGDVAGYEAKYGKL
ncbi:MAG TPA: helix-hairpin-helix domain-containing protein [Sphingobium sp.]|uniref:helix-hairpin-helix domain-containing protein n=1 Tax=Sphingobium sp. TaxID=1912891 RepID=UPI002ED43485